MNTQRISVNEVGLNVRTDGQGPTLLMVHGYPLDHHLWREQQQVLAETHRVVSPDLRGFGLSDVTMARVDMEQFADDLASLIDSLSITEPVTLCGLSMGGYVAWQFWRRHPEKLHRLILCDTRAIADDDLTATARRISASQIEAEGVGELAESMPAKLLSARSLDNQPLVEHLKTMIRNTPPNGAAAALRGMSDRPDVTPWLPDINVPTLVMCGRHDAISTIDEMRQLADSMPNATFVEIADAGHLAPLENPLAVNAAIRNFLDQ